MIGSVKSDAYRSCNQNFCLPILLPAVAFASPNSPLYFPSLLSLSLSLSLNPNLSHLSPPPSRRATRFRRRRLRAPRPSESVPFFHLAIERPSPPISLVSAPCLDGRSRSFVCTLTELLRNREG